MALNFNANQYEQAYKPRILRNWEVPKQYRDKPHKRSGCTAIIGDDRGHLIPGVPKSKESPWGNFVGTWNLPKHISREQANQLSGLAKKTKREKVPEVPLPRQVIEEPVKTESKKDIEVEVKIATEEENENVPYVPGDLTDENHRLYSHEILAGNRMNQDSNNVKYSSQGYPKYRDDFSKPVLQPEPSTIPRNEVESIYKNHQEMSEAHYSQHKKSHKKKKSPILSAIKNFQLAKKLHQENLEHDPLPDTISHTKFRQLQLQKEGPDPGCALKEDHFATGVGWKGYPGYGPNRCTKMKVYRPKTCCPISKSPEKNKRPSSVSSFDRKWRFIRQRKVSPIELAICWDLTPENAEDEPKRTPHIDGSNGSLAPAVFSLIHTPKAAEGSRKTSDGALFEKGPIVLSHEKEFVLDRPKTAMPEVKRRPSRESVQSEQFRKKRAKSSYNLHGKLEQKGAFSGCSCGEHEMHQSTPNLSDLGKERRLCMACEMKNVCIDERPAKAEYKAAFKAGVPQKCVSSPSRVCRIKYNVPKQKDPYRHRNYAICSLAPPFSLQKDKRQDYPEHWRLATVYQHSYKPIHARKRPLWATVFK